MKRGLLSVVLGMLLAAAITGCGKSTENTEQGDSLSFSTENTSSDISGKETAAKESVNAETAESIAAEGTQDSVPDSFMITSENYFDYQSRFECSAFSSAYVLRHYGEKADGVELFKNFPQKFEDESGVLPNGILQFFDERGYDAEYLCDGTTEDLKKQISRGVPVIVFIHLIEPYENPYNIHYVPVVGYDSEYFYFAESLSDYANCKEEKDVPYNRKTEISKFQRLWSNINGYWDNPYFIISKK